MNHLKQAGFTLIEVLIVFTLLSILTIIAVSAYTGTQKKARDTQVIGNIKDMQKALELYYQLNGNQYPADAAALSILDDERYFQRGLRPKDPRTNQFFTNYTRDASNNYCLCSFELEREETGNSTNASCTFTGTPKTFFCVENVQ